MRACHTTHRAHHKNRNPIENWWCASFSRAYRTRGYTAAAAFSSVYVWCICRRIRKKFLYARTDSEYNTHTRTQYTYYYTTIRSKTRTRRRGHSYDNVKCMCVLCSVVRCVIRENFKRVHDSCTIDFVMGGTIPNSDVASRVQLPQAGHLDMV